MSAVLGCLRSPCCSSRGRRQSGSDTSPPGVVTPIAARTPYFISLVEYDADVDALTANYMNVTALRSEGDDSILWSLFDAHVARRVEQGALLQRATRYRVHWVKGMAQIEKITPPEGVNRGNDSSAMDEVAAAVLRGILEDAFTLERTCGSTTCEHRDGLLITNSIVGALERLALQPPPLDSARAPVVVAAVAAAADSELQQAGGAAVV